MVDWKSEECTISVFSTEVFQHPIRDESLPVDLYHELRNIVVVVLIDGCGYM